MLGSKYMDNGGVEAMRNFKHRVEREDESRPVTDNPLDPVVGIGSLFRGRYPPGKGGREKAKWWEEQSRLVEEDVLEKTKLKDMREHIGAGGEKNLKLETYVVCDDRFNTSPSSSPPLSLPLLPSLSLPLSLSPSLSPLRSVSIHVHLFHQSFYLSIHPSIHPSAMALLSSNPNAQICLSICPSVHLSVCLPIHLSIHLSVRPSVRPSVRLSVRLSSLPSTRLPACFPLRLLAYTYQFP